jgi:hypothetical protein
LLVQLFGLRFGGVADALRLLFKLVGLRVCLCLYGAPLILQRVGLGIARLRSGTIDTICGPASPLSRAVPS